MSLGKIESSAHPPPTPRSVSTLAQRAKGEKKYVGVGCSRLVVVCSRLEVEGESWMFYGASSSQIPSVNTAYHAKENRELSVQQRGMCVTK